MKGTYKYQELWNYFSNLKGDYKKLTFEEIEKIIGFELPTSAYKYSAYWHPSKTHTICGSWDEHGWKMIGVKLGEYVEFENR